MFPEKVRYGHRTFVKKPGKVGELFIKKSDKVVERFKKNPVWLVTFHKKV